MEVKNTLQKQDESPKTFTSWLGQPSVSASLMNSLKSEKAVTKFTSNLLSVVSTNPALQTCDFPSIVSAGVLANSLDMSLSPSLGFAYLLPFNDTKNNRTVATFVLGYRGYIQLAIRSDAYRKINVMEIKAGELIKYDPLYEEIEIKLIEDDEVREATPTIGYYAMIELTNGFRKIIYWSWAKMLTHADRYSKAFSKDETKVKTKFGEVTKVSYSDYIQGKYDTSKEWLYSSYWYKDFDGMAKKTLIRQIISKWGIMSTEFKNAFEADTIRIENNENNIDFSASFEATQRAIEEDFFIEPETGEIIKDASEKKAGKKEKTTETVTAETFFDGN